MGSNTILVGGTRKILRVDIRLATVETVVDESIGNVFALIELNEDTVLCGGDNGKICLYDNTHKEIYNEEQCHSDFVSSLLVYKDQWIISGSGDETIKVWSFNNKK